MMTLTKKILLYIACTYLFAIAILFFASKLLIETKFYLIEENKVRENLERAYAAIIDKANNISISTTDYAGWDDSYKYVVDHNEEFEKSNLVNETFVSLKVNVIAYVNNDNMLVFGKAVDIDSGLDLPLPPELQSIITKDLPLKKFDTNTQSNTGLVMFSGKPFLIVANPIVTSKKEGPQNGVLIMGRFLDDNLIGEIAKTTKLPIQIVSEKNDPKLLANVESLGENTYIKNDSYQINTGFMRLTDVYGQTPIVIKISTSRDIYREGQKTVALFLLVLIIGGTASMILGLLLLRRILVKPVNKLIYELEQVKKSGNATLRISSTGKDEISFIATEINNMLISLEKTKNQLLDLNYELDKQKRNVETQVVLRSKQLHDEHIKLLAAIDGSPYGFLLFNTDKRCLLSNNVSKKMFNTNDITFDMVSQKLNADINLSTLFDKTVKDTRAQMIDNVALDNKIFKVYTSPVLENYLEIKGVIVTIIDVTEEKVLDRAKDELFTIASHELKTPLTAIKGNIELIKDLYYSKIQNGDIKKMFDDISIAAKRMVHIVNDFLTASKLENSKVNFNYKKFDLETTVRGVLSEWSALLLENDIQGIIEVNTNKENLEAYADPEKTAEILSNLISNAIKYVNKGYIKISLNKVGEFLEVEVADNGKGIAEENQKFLFRKFQQAGSSIYARDITQGTGLGLYISKLIVENMGGSLKLKSSKLGVGTTFVFTLPTKKG